MKKQRQISTRRSKTLRCGVAPYSDIKQRQGGVVFAGQLLTDPLKKKPCRSRIARRNRQVVLNRVGKKKKGFKSAFLFDVERALMDIPGAWKDTCIDEAIQDTEKILRGEDICQTCRTDLWEPGSKVSTEEEQVLRCMERGTPEDRQIARNIRDLLREVG